MTCKLLLALAMSAVVLVGCEERAPASEVDLAIDRILNVTPSKFGEFLKSRNDIILKSRNDINARIYADGTTLC